VNLRHETARAVRRLRRSAGRPNLTHARYPGLQRFRGPDPGKPVRVARPTHRLPCDHRRRQDVQFRQETRVRLEPE